MVYLSPETKDFPYLHSLQDTLAQTILLFQIVERSLDRTRPPPVTAAHRTFNTFLNSPILVLKLKPWLPQSMNSIGIKTIYDLTQVSEKTLLRIPGLGDGTLRKIKKTLEEHQLTLATFVEPPAP
jgi:hypothetical protein